MNLLNFPYNLQEMMQEQETGTLDTRTSYPARASGNNKEENNSEPKTPPKDTSSEFYDTDTDDS
ncbi:MAG: hypothetical protein GC192_16035 [Bacteroidetes bacterium]|nr:hypothetical protein [Bacteroidota bacterium]